MIVWSHHTPSWRRWDGLHHKCSIFQPLCMIPACIIISCAIAGRAFAFLAVADRVRRSVGEVATVIAAPRLVVEWNGCASFVAICVPALLAIADCPDVALTEA